MSNAEQNAIFDDWTTLVGGVNSGEHPARVPRTQAYRAINASFRGGSISTRPGFNHVPVNIELEGEREVFEKGNFQGCAYYRGDGARYLVVAIGGWIFVIDPIKGTTRNIGNDVGQNDPTVDRMQFEQVDRWLVIQDGINRPVILENNTARRSDPDAYSTLTVLSNSIPATDDQPEVPAVYAQGEIPVSYYMAFGQGRLFFARKNTNEFLAGDLLIGGLEENALLATENVYLAGGGSFKLPDELGNITGMTFMDQIDTSLGVGALIVHAENGIAAYDVAQARSQWGTQQIGRVIYKGPAATCPETLVNVNNEIYFMSKDGIRSIKQAVADFTTMIDTPLSREINVDLEKATPWLDHMTDSFVFDKRVMFLGLPFRFKREEDRVDVAHRCLFVMDYDYSSQLRGQSAKPVYDGMWTGFNFLGGTSGIFGDAEHAYVIAERNGVNGIYELSSTSYRDDERNIETRIYTKGYDFQSDNRYNPVFPHSLKVLSHVDLWLEGLRDEVDIDVFFTTDDQPQWYSLGEWSHSAPYSYANAPSLSYIPFATERPYPDFQTFSAPDDVQDITCRNKNKGYYFQLRIDIKGYARIRMGRLKGKHEPSEPVYAEQHDIPETQLNITPPDDFAYNADHGRHEVYA